MKKNRTFLAVLGEIGFLAISLWLFFAFGGGEPSNDATAWHPTPDTQEQVWMAAKIAEGKSPLLPIGTELHPSRYSIIHPIIVSGWIKLNGGDWQAVRTWSTVAVLLGCLLFHLFLVASKTTRPVRVVATTLIVTSTAMIRVSQNCMQEPTIWLLFSLSCLSWQLATRAKDHRHKQLFGSIAGGAAGGLVCIRPTYLIWPVLLFLMSFLFDPKSGKKIWTWFGLGISLIIGGGLFVTHQITDIWGLTLYQLWGKTEEYFLLGNFFQKLTLSDYPTETAWEQILMDLIGIRDGLSFWGPLFSSSLLIASPLCLLLWKKGSNKNNLLPVLFFFGVGQIIVHTFYFFYGARFLLPAFAGIIACGCVGVGTLLDLLPPKKRVLISGLILSVGLYFISGTNQRRTALQTSLIELTDRGSWRRTQGLIAQESFRQDATRLQAINCPIFVDQVNPLMLRLYADLSAGQTIYQLESKIDREYDCQLFQKPECGAPLIDRSIPSSAVFIKEKTLSTLLNKHGKVVLYIPRKKAAELKDLFPNARDLSSEKSHWKILLII